MVETTGGAKGRNGLAVWALAVAASVNAPAAKKEFIMVFIAVISWVQSLFFIERADCKGLAVSKRLILFKSPEASHMSPPTR
jgi:hypothetical protein